MRISKIVLRVPCLEPYAYIEIEIEGAESEEEIIEEYNHLTKLVKQNGEGLTEKEFNDALDKYLSDDNEESLHSEEYANMNEEQKNIIQTLKRAFKRLKARASKGMVDSPFN